MSITTQILLTLFATVTSINEKIPELCDTVYTDTGRPVFCEPHREGAPRFAGTVCCDEGTCFEGREGYCLDDEKPFYCELGEAHTSGEVSCYFEVPTYCEVFACGPGFQAQPQEAAICCHAGVCWNTYPSSNDCEPNDIYWCDDGVTNQDGTVTCFD